MSTMPMLCFASLVNICDRRLTPGHSLGPYADKSMLAKYIPELDPENARAKTLRSKLAKRTYMLRIQFISAMLVVALNVGLTIWFFVDHDRIPIDGRGVGTFTFGHCTTITRINSALHVALNIVSSLFLAAGNYCMQILVAPSRLAIECAGKKGHSLEIGVPSLRNFRIMYKSRALKWSPILIWLSLGIISTVLHVL